MTARREFSGTTDLVRTLPADWYRRDDIYQHERDRVFGREWLYYAPEATLAHPKAAVARTYAGHRLLVVRSPEGTLAGFHNVCRHRAAPLVSDGEQACGNLVCPYHGWAYEFDGSLRSARDFGADIDPAANGLFPVHVATWRGLVFVHLGEHPEPLHEQLGEVFGELASVPVESFSLGRRNVHTLACNWKTYADNYLEGYHIPLLHPELNRQIDARAYRLSVHDRWIEHQAPTRDGAACEGRWLYLWPNLAINAYDDALNVEHIVPVAPGKCLVHYDFLTVDPTSQRHAEAFAFSNLVMDEDREISEAVQTNLEAGRYDRGILSPRHEPCVAWFHRRVRSAVGVD